MKKRLMAVITALAIMAAQSVVLAEGIEEDLQDIYSTYVVVDNSDKTPITYEEVLAKVESYSLSGKNYNLALDTSEKKVSSANTQYANSFDFSDLQTSLSNSVSYSQLKEEKSVFDETLKYTVKQAYVNVIMLEKSVELQKIAMETQKLSLAISEKKNELGLMSDEDYNTALLAYESAKVTQQETEDELESEYEAINRLMGVDTSNRYSFEYPAYYEKLSLATAIDTYANTVVSNSGSVAVSKSSVESAESTKTISLAQNSTSVYTSNVYYYEELVNNVSTAKNNLSSTKDSVEEEVKNLYTTIMQSELNIDKAIIEFESKIASLERVETQYDMGLVSEYVLVQSEYEVAAYETSLLQSIYSHMLNVEKINNPTLF